MSDGAGKFAFNAVPPGAYTINAQAPGLAANRTIEVTAGSASEITLEMKVKAVVESTTVTANTDQIDTKESSGTSTIGESAVKNVPNLDERFQNLLPLIPGVVRGPNGLINMKGAQASQNGSLLNSADVTDPATGTSALNIPNGQPVPRVRGAEKCIAIPTFRFDRLTGLAPGPPPDKGAPCAHRIWRL